MRILIACEFSGVVSHAFRKRGHEVTSCDLLPLSPKLKHSPTPEEFKEMYMNHIGGDVTNILTQSWDMMIAFPPCTYLCASGMHWTYRGLRDPELTEKAVKFVMSLWTSKIPKICVENPVGILSTRIGKPDQIIQPYWFGHDASKSTCLWLKNLPPLKGTAYIPPRIEEGKNRWGNQTKSGCDRTPPSKDRGLKRSVTYAGIAEAMAEQWGGDNK